MRQNIRNKNFIIILKKNKIKKLNQNIFRIYSCDCIKIRCTVYALYYLFR
jgi:hypothetical protein